MHSGGTSSKLAASQQWMFEYDLLRQDAHLVFLAISVCACDACASRGRKRGPRKKLVAATDRLVGTDQSIARATTPTTAVLGRFTFHVIALVALQS